MRARTLTVLIEQDEDGYFVATVPALRSCYTQAKSLATLRKRVIEALKGKPSRLSGAGVGDALIHLIFQQLVIGRRNRAMVRPSRHRRKLPPNRIQSIDHVAKPLAILQKNYKSLR